MISIIFIVITAAIIIYIYRVYMYVYNVCITYCMLCYNKGFCVYIYIYIFALLCRMAMRRGYRPWARAGPQGRPRPGRCRLRCITAMPTGRPREQGNCFASQSHCLVLFRGVHVIWIFVKPVWEHMSCVRPA